MPQPTISDVHIDRYLSNLSVGYLQNPGDFVATQVFPMVPVDNKTDYYLKYNRGDFFRDDMQERAPGTPVNGGGYKQANGTYSCKVWASKKVIDDQTASNCDSPINLDRDATQWLTQKALINREVQWGSTYFGTGIWGYERKGGGATNATDVLYWDNTSGDPRLDILAARTAVKKATGYWPNTLVIGAKVEEKLVQNAKIIDLLKYGQAPGTRTDISAQDLAALFRVERVLTMSAIKTTSQEDMVTDSDTTPDTFDFIGGNHALLCYSAPSPGLMQPSAGYTFNWTGYSGANGAGMKIKKYRWEIDSAYHMEVEQTYGFGLVSKYLGAFFKDVLTP